MSSLSSSPRYAELAEWQLYNAASVGISRSGSTYFYRNPLEMDGNIQRHPWFDTACCPSNISCLWARTGSYCLTPGVDGINLNQFISGTYENAGLKVVVQSGLPWSGQVSIQVENITAVEVFLNIRRPGWAGRASGKELQFDAPFFEGSSFQRVTLFPGESRLLRLDFPMDAYKIRSHPRVKPNRGRIAIARGPLLYCLEEADHPGLNLSEITLDSSSLLAVPGTDLPGQINLKGQSIIGENLLFTPYFDWGNRSPGAMRLWIKVI